MISPFPHTSSNNMPATATSPPRRRGGRGPWFSLPRRGRGIGTPSPAGLTPTAVTDTPPGTGRGLRSSPHGGAETCGTPQSRGEEVWDFLPLIAQGLPLPVSGASAPPQEWARSGCARMRSESLHWQPHGSPQCTPYTLNNVCSALSPYKTFP